MPAAAHPSARRQELLALAYRHVLAHGLSDLSLRPLAAAIHSSPRVLLFLFGSKDGLIRALLARAREDERTLLDDFHTDGRLSLAQTAREIWRWLSAEEHRGLLILWTESYARSLTAPAGVWGGFAADTVEDWLALLASAQPTESRRTAAGRAQRTLVLATLRGALLDLLATGDRTRTTAAVRAALSHIT
jgi:AcrR family transcriptional regulator